MEKVYSVVTVRGVPLDFNCWKAFLAMSVSPIWRCFHDRGFVRKINRRGINSIPANSHALGVSLTAAG